MCGIAGLINYGRDNWKDVMQRMNLCMKDRGPDATGIWSNSDHTVVLGHQRLSIVDLSETGSQPMKSHSGRYLMVYNGEIYNSGKLAKRLIDDGCVKEFRGTSDTEILLEAIEAYGLEPVIKYCKGMFAIGLFDNYTRELSLVRDRIGEKPLYYGFVNGTTFAFASDVKCFREIDGFENAINRDVLGVYFAHGYIPAPYSIYKDIYKLEPGMILRIASPYVYFDPVKNGDLERYYKTSAVYTLKKVGIDDLRRIGENKEYPVKPGTYQYTTYWSVREQARSGQENLFKGSEAEAADALEMLLKKAIRGQMTADVPVGAFLSAGIDSSTIVSLMQQVMPGKVRTFTIGMQDPKYNEAEIAKKIAEHIGTDHTELYISDDDARKVVPLLPDMFGEPFADSSQIPTYLVSKMTRQHVTVSLSGDAGDELFCGYRSYDSVNRIWGKMENIPYSLRSAAGTVLSHIPMMRTTESSIVLRDKSILLKSKGPEDLYRRQYELDPMIAGIAGGTDKVAFAYNRSPQNYLKEVNHEIMLMDMTMYHPDDILAKVDRTAMACSLETRVPFLDRDVVEFAWTLPQKYLKSGNTGKKILRDILYRYVPEELVNRPKKGFSIPIASWLKSGELRDWAEELMNPAKIREQGYLDDSVVGRIWHDFTDKGIWRIQIWYVLMFQQWLENSNKK